MKEILIELEFRTVGKRLLGEELTPAPTGQAQKAGSQPSLFDTGGNESSESNSVAAGAGDSDRSWDGPVQTINDVAHNYELVESEGEFAALMEVLNKTTEISFDTETTSSPGHRPG